MNRRVWLGGGVAVAATAAGLGWRLLGESSDPPTGAAASHDAGAAAALWSLSLATPTGGRLDLSTLRGRPLVLNFWATWCPPCIKEMPELDRFHREYGGRGWQVLGLAIDSEAAVRDFLARHPVGYPIALVGFEGVELSRRLGNDKAALPFTVVFDAAGRRVRIKLGETGFDELAGWARSL